MKSFRQFVIKALVSGFFIAVPVYLAMLLLLKALKSLSGLVRPLAVLHPSGVSTEAAQNGLAFLVVLAICFVLGVAVLTKRGRAAGDRIQRSVLAKIPGYTLVRDLTQQLAGQGHENVWRPALVEIEEGLVPAFIIEEVRDSRFTVYVPSVPSPLAGSVYILREERVHPVNASFAQTFQALSRWGSGVKDLVAAMESEPRDAEAHSRPSAERKYTKIA
jgi:uncharacterized membrane protein